MIGAGVFVVFAPAAAAAGTGLLIGLLVAAVVAYCNADSSARLAALYPESGGSYVYGRRRLGPFWGYLAGWSFVVGKTASCAAMALTVGLYLWPDHAHAVAVAAVAALTALNYRGVRKSVWLTRVIVAITVAALAGVVGVVARSGETGPLTWGPTTWGPTTWDPTTWGPTTVSGVLQAAGLLFFAFAGYARIATLGEEVRDPARTIPRAIPLALLLTLAVYASVAVAVLIALGPDGLARSSAPLADAVRIAGAGWLEPAVRAAAALAALGSLLSLILGVSRTVLAMARDRHLPGALAAVHARFGVPHRAEVAVGVVVGAVAAAADVRAAIGFSSFAVLVYYTIANASAFTLNGRRWVPVLGVAGCVTLAVFLPAASIAAGAAVTLAGAAVFAIGALRSR